MSEREYYRYILGVDILAEMARIRSRRRLRRRKLRAQRRRLMGGR